MCWHTSPKPKKTTKESQISITFPFSSAAAHSRHEHTFICLQYEEKPENDSDVSKMGLWSLFICGWMFTRFPLVVKGSWLSSFLLNNIEVLPFFWCSCISLTALLCPGDHFFASASDEEVIFRSFDGDILKVNTHNQTELLMKNTTFVRFLFRCFECVMM